MRRPELCLAPLFGAPGAESERKAILVINELREAGWHLISTPEWQETVEEAQRGPRPPALALRLSVHVDDQIIGCGQIIHPSTKDRAREMVREWMQAAVGKRVMEQLCA